jgi:hypothetical protein
MDGRGEIGYSGRMTNDIAPLITIRAPAPKRPRPYPDPATRLGKAWQVAWDKLRADGGFIDGTELSVLSAETQGLSPATMNGVLARAATQGLLVREYNVVDGTRGPRKRTSYRIPQS